MFFIYINMMIKCANNLLKYLVFGVPVISVKNALYTCSFVVLPLFSYALILINVVMCRRSPVLLSLFLVLYMII